MGIEKSLLLTVAVVAVTVGVLMHYTELPEEEIVFREMPRFESYAELEAAFEEAGQHGRNYGIMDTVMGGIPAAVPLSKGVAESSNGPTQGYSTTNTQVEGVDEADIVKSDGKYIYAFSGNRLVIVDAYPAETGEVASKTEFEDVYPQEMFVSGDKLLVFGSEGSGKYYTGMEYMPYGSGTVARLYDISDRANPVEEKELEFEGSYLTSRLIGEKAYFAVNSWPQRGCEEEECIIPLMRENGVESKVAEAEEIGYIPPMPAESFVTIASIDLGSGETEKETIAGSAQNVYASQNAVYLAATSWMPHDTLVPKGSVAKGVETAIIGTEEKTVINKFGLKEGKIGFMGQGSVPGHVLNQFSMDEFQGNFRIATTLGHVSRTGSESTNNLYVLNQDMETVGRLEDLAPGERIYSARFMGNKAYMVTFRKVDPLFVIDVSNPENPTVLGKLKIPGYSDYLHPIDEGHLIGIGKETIEAAKGDFAWYQGLKMAVFDVTDVENPKEMHKIVIGDRGTDSYALHDHKAFLYDKEKELLVLPIMLAEILEEEKKPLGEEQISPSYGQPVFQGAFVFRLSLENGFEEKGRITHISEEEELKRGYYFGQEYSVMRSMYIGDALYTLSQKMLKANDLHGLEELKEFSFG